MSSLTLALSNAFDKGNPVYAKNDDAQAAQYCRAIALPVLWFCNSCRTRQMAQSLNPKSPAPLKSGSNRATIDSFGTEQFWGFTAEPGHFQIVFTRLV